MHRLLLGLAVSLALTSRAHAQTDRVWQLDTAEGFSTNGRYFVLTGSMEAYTQEGPLQRAQVARVIDLLTGKQEDYLLVPLAVEGGGEGSHLKLGSTEQYRAWLGKHPLQKPAPFATTCADAELQVSLVDHQGYADLPPKLQHQGNRWTYNQGGGATFTAQVKRAGQTWTHIEQTLDAAWMLEEGKSATAWWSPDCLRVVWARADLTPRGFRDSYGPELRDTQVEVHLAGPRILLMAHESAQAKLEAAAQRFAKAGYGVFLGPAAQKKRTASVIYAWSGARAVAQVISKKVLGGATVEPLTWPVDADIVVALGGELTVN